MFAILGHGVLIYIVVVALFVYRKNLPNTLFNNYKCMSYDWHNIPKNINSHNIIKMVYFMDFWGTKCRYNVQTDSFQKQNSFDYGILTTVKIIK